METENRPVTDITPIQGYRLWALAARTEPWTTVSPASWNRLKSRDLVMVTDRPNHPGNWVVRLTHAGQLAANEWLLNGPRPDGVVVEVPK